jgi:hypothetical protein
MPDTLMGDVRDFSSRKSELVLRVAEGALGEGEDLGWRDREHEGHPTTCVVKAAVARLELPSPVPLCGPCPGEAFEHVIVSELEGFALDHDIEPCVPVVAAGRQNHVWVPTQVHGLLFGGAGAEVESPIEPHGNQRSDVGSTVGPHRRDPEQLGLLQHATRLLPSRGNRVRVAEARVDFRDGFVHQKNSFRSLGERGKGGTAGSFPGFWCFIREDTDRRVPALLGGERLAKSTERAAKLR